jgi:hypothetical protein
MPRQNKWAAAYAAALEEKKRAQRLAQCAYRYDSASLWYVAAMSLRDGIGLIPVLECCKSVRDNWTAAAVRWEGYAKNSETRPKEDQARRSHSAQVLPVHRLESVPGPRQR